MNEMNAMFHRHLVAAYAATWIIQLTYLGYVVRKWIEARKAQQVTRESQPPR